MASNNLDLHDTLSQYEFNSVEFYHQNFDYFPKSVAAFFLAWVVFRMSMGLITRFQLAWKRNTGSNTDVAAAMYILMMCILGFLSWWSLFNTALNDRFTSGGIFVLTAFFLSFSLPKLAHKLIHHTK